MNKKIKTLSAISLTMVMVFCVSCPNTQNSAACVQKAIASYNTSPNVKLLADPLQTKALDRESAIRLPPIFTIPNLNAFLFLVGKIVTPPNTIYGGVICGYLNPAHPDCNETDLFPPAIKYNKDRIVNFAPYVGRLEIRRPKVNQDGTPGYDYYIWGTAVLVGNGVIATSCHVIDSVTKDDGYKPELNLDHDQSLIVDFGDDSGYYPATNSAAGKNPKSSQHTSGAKKQKAGKNANNGDNPENSQYEVQELLGCSRQLGIDVALLKLCPTSVNNNSVLSGFHAWFITDRPDPSHIQEELRSMAIIGTPDLEHPINPVTQDIYSRYEGKQYAKFVVFDTFDEIDPCGESVDIMLDTTTTTVGESGAPVIKLITPPPDGRQLKGDEEKYLIAGIHTCCSVFSDDLAYKPPRPDLSCANLRRTVQHQAVSSWSIVRDPFLCPILKANDGLPANFQCPAGNGF